MATALALAALLAGCAMPLAAKQESAPWLAEREVFLHSAMTLSAAPENETHAIAMRPFFQAWAAGDDYPTWLLDPLGEDALVTSLTVTLVARATGPVVGTHFPDVMVYAGSGEAWIGYGDLRDATHFAPGETHEIPIEVALPEGGMWIPSDAPLGIKVVPVMLQQEQTNLEILVGGDQPSFAAVTFERLDVPRGAVTAGERAGEVVGTIYAGAAAPPTTSQRTPLALPPGASYVVAWMNTTGNVGVPDIDLSIEAPDGTVLATSGTPTPREALRLAAPNLRGPGEYQLVVTTAGSPRAEYALQWRVGTSG